MDVLIVDDSEVLRLHLARILSDFPGVSIKREAKDAVEAEELTALQIPKAAALLARNIKGERTGPDEFTLVQKVRGRVPVEINTYSPCHRPEDGLDR